MVKNEKYSHQNFSDQSFLDIDPEEFNNTHIVGSCFFQTPKYGDDPGFVKIFPDIKNVTFFRCNLDNVAIPDNCDIQKGTHKLLKVQNDLEMWECNTDGTPGLPIDHKLRDASNILKHPADLPLTKFTKQEREAFRNKINKVTVL
ncbi:MAG: hypothetical protein ACTSPB_02990 [Candidatus Thorarchaeota archaeon]